MLPGPRTLTYKGFQVHFELWDTLSGNRHGLTSYTRTEKLYHGQSAVAFFFWFVPHLHTSCQEVMVFQLHSFLKTELLLDGGNLSKGEGA